MPEPTIFSALVTTFGILLLPVLFVLALWMARSTDIPATSLANLKDRLGLTLPGWVLTPLALVWLLLLTMLVFGLFWVVVTLLWQAGAQTQEKDLRWSLLTLTALTAALGAVVAMPFTLIRTHSHARQTEVAEQGLLADRITRSVEALSNDDIIVRTGAIYALEKIMRDSVESRISLWKIVNAYLLREQESLTIRVASPTQKRLREDLQAALDVLTRNNGSSR